MSAEAAVRERQVAGGLPEACQKMVEGDLLGFCYTYALTP
jgi:hypothetical protein